MFHASSPQLVSAGNPGPLTGAGNNTWLIDGGVPALVDAGVGAPAHLDAIGAALGTRGLARVLVTHGHADHASGVTALRARWPGLDACKFPLAGDSGWSPLADGARVRAGDDELVVIHTPGHAPDHVCFWNARTRDLFAGDMVLADTTVLVPAGRRGNLRDYLASLERLLALDAARILPGHGRIVDRPADRIREYLAHRRERESQIAALVDAGVRDVDALVDRIYPGLAAPLRGAARVTVEAHLEKLRDEGRAPRASHSSGV